MALLIAAAAPAYAQTSPSPEDLARGTRYLKGALAACKYESNITKDSSPQDKNKPKIEENVPLSSATLQNFGNYDPLSHYYFVLKKGGPVKRIMNCIDIYLWAIAKDQLQKIMDMISFPARLLLVIYLIIIGFRLALGDISGAKTRSELVMAGLMIMAVLYFVRFGITDYYQVFKATQAKTVDLVTRNVAFRQTFKNPDVQGCDPKSTTGVPRIDDIWERFDCVIAYMLGSNVVKDPRTIDGVNVLQAKTLEKSGNMAFVPFEMSAPDSNYLFILATGLVSVHPAGIFVVIVVLMSLIFLAAAILQAAVSYVVALVSITFLALIGPVMIPLMLFHYTRDMFLYWLRMLFAYTLSPALLFAYLSFMLQVLQFGIHGFPNGASATDNIFYGFGVTKYYERVRDLTYDKTKRTMCSILKSETKTEEKEDPLKIPAIEQLPQTALPGVAKNFIQNITGNLMFQEKGKSAFTLDVPCLDIDAMVVGDEGTGAEKAQKKELFIKGLIRSFTILAMLLAVTVGFMHNVMAFADKLAGLGPVGNITQALQVYGRVAHRIASAASGK